MKEFAAFILRIVLICVGWNQPYKAHFSSVVGEPPPGGGAGAVTAGSPGVPTAASAALGQTPAPDSSWLWKKSTLDLPEGRTGGGKHGR